MKAFSNTNLYDVLGIDCHAGRSDVRKAYLRLALERHPDKNRGDNRAVAEFQQILHAYEVLHDKNKRRLYNIKCGFSERDHVPTPPKTDSRHRSEGPESESSKVQRRDEVWRLQSQSRAFRIARLRQELATIESAIAEMRLKDEERLSKKKNFEKGLFGYVSSALSAKVAKTEEAKRKEELGRIEQLTSLSIRYQKAKIELEQAQRDHWETMERQDRVRQGERADGYESL